MTGACEWPETSKGEAAMCNESHLERWGKMELKRRTFGAGAIAGMAAACAPMEDDTMASANPQTVSMREVSFPTGEGIAYGYQTGRMAATTIHRALAADDLSLLRRYPEELEAEFGDYYRVGKVFVRAIGNPHIMRAFMTVGFKSRPLMEWTFRVMSNLMPPEDHSLTRQLYGAIEAAVRLAPAGLGTDN